MDDLTRLIAIIRKLLSFYTVDRETREAIARMKDEEIIAFANATLDEAETNNEALREEIGDVEEI